MRLKLDAGLLRHLVDVGLSGHNPSSHRLLIDNGDRASPLNVNDIGVP